jgi:hypothetical protein
VRLWITCPLLRAARLCDASASSCRFLHLVCCRVLCAACPQRPPHRIPPGASAHSTPPGVSRTHAPARPSSSLPVAVAVAVAAACPKTAPLALCPRPRPCSPQVPATRRRDPTKPLPFLAHHEPLRPNARLLPFSTPSAAAVRTAPNALCSYFASLPSVSARCAWRTQRKAVSLFTSRDPSSIPGPTPKHVSRPSARSHRPSQPIACTGREIETSPMFSSPLETLQPALSPVPRGCADAAAVPCRCYNTLAPHLYHVYPFLNRTHGLVAYSCNGHRLQLGCKAAVENNDPSPFEPSCSLWVFTEFHH